MDMMTRMDARREQMLRELASDLADLVEAGDLTAEQANEWYAAKADQWAKE
jgi:polyhydroxyalkanoate synthesis regulator phasin